MKCVLILVLVLMTGCASLRDGVIGPVSYYHAQEIHKDTLVQIQSDGTGVGVGVDLFQVSALRKQPVRQLTAEAADIGLYSIIYWLARALYEYEHSKNKD